MFLHISLDPKKLRKNNFNYFGPKFDFETQKYLKCSKKQYVQIFKCEFSADMADKVRSAPRSHQNFVSCPD